MLIELFMTKETLAKYLECLGVRQDAYDLTSELPNEALTLNWNGQRWEVYYSERGKKTGLKLFSDEDSACRYLLSLIVQDRTAIP
jgi:hypothetical protein